VPEVRQFDDPAEQVMNFPFGSPLKKVEQTDRSPKKVFVLGVYASAVHAKWLAPDGSIKVKALAVASEPAIHILERRRARGHHQADQYPARSRHLSSGRSSVQRPIGNALNDLFLKPLGYTRDDAWLSDLLPYSRINVNQQAAGLVLFLRESRTRTSGEGGANTWSANRQDVDLAFAGGPAGVGRTPTTMRVLSPLPGKLNPFCKATYGKGFFMHTCQYLRVPNLCPTLKSIVPAKVTILAGGSQNEETIQNEKAGRCVLLHVAMGKMLSHNRPHSSQRSRTLCSGRA